MESNPRQVKIINIHPPLKSKAYDEERNSEVDCADYRVDCDGDSDSDGNGIMYWVLNKKKSVLE